MRLLLALLLFAQVSQAQDSVPGEQVATLSKPNALIAEVLGRGGFWSICYDRRLSTALAFGAGISQVTVSGTLSTGETFWVSNFTVPIYGSLYLLGVPHQIYVTAGASFGLPTNGGTTTVTLSRLNNSPIALVAGIGYEYRPPEGSPLVRVTPYLYLGPAGLAVSLGLALGFAF